ncbi:MAG TPA: aldehyde dehydrogenase family protein, partial [Balneolales bacterium]|nr:aldehyde dehydrogenase family protein [Balneolales bacterium]
MIAIKNYVEGRWIRPNGDGEMLSDAATGEIAARLPGENPDYLALLEYGRNVGGPSLRQLTIHERASKLKTLARYLNERKNEFYELSYHTGATKADSWIDIDGGIGTLFVTSSKARREMQDEHFFIDGLQEALSKKGTFIGQHIYVPREGVAVHINAFNFPVWGMLEKLGAALIAGMPAIIKPSPIGSYLAFAVFEAIIESGLFPEGSMQFIAVDQPGDLLDHLNSQDVVAFTGSAATGEKIRSNPNVIRKNVRVNLETDSLNCSILGPDVSPDMEEFGLFIREVTNEMTSKAGQK